MDNIYVHADLLRVYKAILNATQDIALWLRRNTRKYHTRTHFLD